VIVCSKRFSEEVIHSIDYPTKHRDARAREWRCPRDFFNFVSGAPSFDLNGCARCDGDAAFTGAEHRVTTSEPHELRRSSTEFSEGKVAGI
jgi:hypothetical protein